MSTAAFNCFMMSTLLCVVGQSSSCTTCQSPLTPSVPSTQTLPGHNPRSTPGPPTVSSTWNPASFQLTVPPTPPDFTIYFQETFQALQLQFGNLRISEVVLNMTNNTVDCLNISAVATMRTGGDTVTMTTGSMGPPRVLAASEAGSQLSRTDIIIVSVCVCGGSVLIVVVVVVVHTFRHNTAMRRHKSSSSSTTTTTTTTTVHHQDSISSDITWSTDGGHIGEDRMCRVKRVISATNSQRELLQRSDSDYCTTTTTTTDDYYKQLHLTTASQQVDYCIEQHVC